MDSVDETTTPEEVAIAEHMKRLRNERGWSQTALADRMRESGAPHITQPMVSRIEQQTRTVHLSEAVALSRILGVSLDELVDPSHQSTDAEKRLRDLESALALAMNTMAATSASLTELVGKHRDAEPSGQEIGGTVAHVDIPAPKGWGIGEEIAWIEAEPLDEHPAPAEPDYGNLSERAAGLKRENDERHQTR